MKKLLLTAVIASFGFFGSAQIMVVSTYNGDLEGAERLTANIGIGYQATDKISAGFAKVKDTIGGDDGYSVFLRYTIKDDIYVTATMPTEDGSDKMMLGLGYSFNVWNSLYFEPSYTMPIKDDANGDRKGKFNMGVAYRF